MIAHASPLEHGLLLVLGTIAIGGYWMAWTSQRRPSMWRLAAWCVGVVALLASMLPVTEEWAQRSFAGHMVQHLLMIVVAAPCLVVAAPVRTMRHLVTTRSTDVERAVFRHWRSAGAPFAAAAFLSVLYLTHLTAIYDLALRNRFVHDVEHVAYVVTAVSLWAAVRSTGQRAGVRRVGSVFAVIAGGALLGVVLLSASSPLVSTYADLQGTDAALDDQRAAASLMWVGGMATTLPMLLIAVWSWASTEERVARRTEALQDAITPARHGSDL